MKLLLKFVMLFSLSFSFCFAAEAPKEKSSDKKAVKYKKNVTLEFDGRSVDGNVVSPDSADVEGDKNLKFEPLLEGRKDFKREFKRSSGVSR